MDISQWLSLIISILLAGVGLYMAYTSSILLARIEEQNRKFDNMMNLVVDRLVQAQVKLLLAQQKISLDDRTFDDEDIKEQAERLKREILPLEEKN
jgi:hypothetical protein